MENPNFKPPDRYYFQIVVVGYGDDEDEALAYVFNKIAKGEEHDVLEPEVIWEKDDDEDNPGDFIWIAEVGHD